MITPYLTFAGNCRAALALYQAAFDSEGQMSRPYGDYVPEGVTEPPQDLSNWVLHAEMDICGTPVWFADEIAQPVTKGNMVKLTVQVPSAAQARKIFEALLEEAQVTLPPTETFYSACHAALVDRFGIGWNIVALEAPSQP